MVKTKIGLTQCLAAAQQLGAVRTFTKPVGMQDFLDVIEELLSHKYNYYSGSQKQHHHAAPLPHHR